MIDRHTIIGMSDAYCRRIADSGPERERPIAQAELERRALRFPAAQLAAARAEARRIDAYGCPRSFHMGGWK